MRLYGYLVILGSLAWLAIVSYAILGDIHRVSHEPLWVFMIPASIMLNIVYVCFSLSMRDRQPNRIKRIFSLWLDAKEAELRDRAKN
jgi:hypothetical protein